MLANAFLFGEELRLREVPFKLHGTLWSRFKSLNLNLGFEHWEKLKYLNDNADDFNSDINYVPRDKGGLYIFFVKCEIITGLTEYPLYIGRAQLTEHQNLRKRVREYFRKYARNYERPKITRMFKYWSKDLYLAYFPLESNEDIIEIEKQIINCLLLPMNDEIPDTEIKQATQAF